MYVKPETRKRITIPDNYGGNAFNQIERVEVPETVPEVTQAEGNEVSAFVESKDEKHGALPFGIGSEELLLLGILLILTQSDEGGDILPFLLILLFLKNGR